MRYVKSQTKTKTKMKYLTYMAPDKEPATWPLWVINAVVIAGIIYTLFNP